MSTWTPPKGAILAPKKASQQLPALQTIESPEGDVRRTITPAWTPPKDAVKVKGEFKAKQEQELANDLGLQKEKPGFFGSFGQMFADFVVNTLPQIMPSGQLANAPTSYEELQKRFPTYELMTKDYFINNPKAIYSQEFSDKLNQTVGKDLATVQRAYPEGGEEAFDLFKRLTMTRKGEKEGALREEITTQKAESEERTKGIVKSYKDVDSPAALSSYLGGLMGQATATSSTMMAGGSVAAQILETQSAYEDGVEKAMELTGKTRKEVEDSPEMKNRINQAAMVAGVVNSILEKTSFGVVTAPVKKLFLKTAASRVLKNGVVVAAGDLAKAMASEGFTEALQDANTQFMSNVGAGMKPAQALKAIKLDQIIDSAIGGAAGGGGMSASGIAAKGAIDIATKEKKEEPAPAATPASAPAPEKPLALPPTSGLVQGTVKISEDPVSTAKDSEDNTIQTYDSGLKDKNGDSITIETITSPDGQVTHQALDGAIVADSREAVAEQLVAKANPGQPAVATEATTPAEVVEAPKPGETKTEKEEVVTPEGKETVTTTTSDKGKKVSKKVVTGKTTKTTTVVTPSAEEKAKKAEKAVPAKAEKPAPSKKVVNPKPKSHAVQEPAAKKVHVQPAPGNSKEVGEGVSKPKEPTQKSEGKKEAKQIDYGNVPKVQQRIVKNNEAGGWTIVSKKNLASKDKTAIYPIIEMKKGDQTVYINTKGDSFKNIGDALAKSEGRPEVKKKGKEKAPVKPAPAPTPVAEKKPVAPSPKKKEASIGKSMAGYTTAELRDFVKNATPEDRQTFKDVIDEMQAEIARRSERKAKKAVERSKAERTEKEPASVEEKKPVQEKKSQEEQKKPVIEEKKVEPAPEKKPAPAEEKKPGKRVPVTPESQDVLDYLAGDMFPETVEDFIDAIQDIADYAGKGGEARARARLDQMVNEGLITVKGKTITPTFEKQGNEYAPQEVEEYKPEPIEKVVAKNSRRAQPIGLVGGANWITGFDLDDLIKIKKWLIKYFTTKGVMPKSTFDAWNKTQADVRLYETRAIETVKKLKKQVKKDYKEKLTDAQIIELNLALEGKTTDPSGKPLLIPKGTLRIINDMRNQIDNLTRRFVRDGVVAGDVAAKFMANLGVYLHRSYEKFDNPLWKEEVGQDSYNRAMDFLRNKYPSYDPVQLKGLIDYLLHSPKAPMAVMKGGTYGSMDLSVLKKRKGDDVLAPEIRALMGEYADPVVNFTRSIGKMAQLVSKNLFQQDVLKQGMADEKLAGEGEGEWFNRQKEQGKYLYAEPIGDFIQKIEATGVPSPLDGLYTTPELAEVLSKFNGISSKEDNPFFRFWKWATGKVNFGLTVANPGAHFRNFGANPMFAIANGHIGNAQTGIDTKIATEEEIQSAEKKRKEYLEAEKKVSNARVQAMSDLAAETKQQNKIDALKKELESLQKILNRRVNAKFSDPATKKAKVDEAKRDVQTKLRTITKEENVLKGIFDQQKLTDAQTALKELIAKGGATTEQLEKARNKVSILTKLKQRADSYIAINDRKTQLAALEKEADALRETAEEFDDLSSLTHRSTWDKKMEKWRSLGLIDDSLLGGMMKDFIRDMKKDPLKEEGLFERGAHGAIKKGYNATSDFVADMYKAGDWVWKVRAFEIEAARYKEAYSDLSQSEIDNIAAENVKNTYPTYSRIPAFIKSLRYLPLGAFAPFPSEVIRTSFNTVELAIKEMRSGNPVLKKIGVKRAVGMITSLSIPTAFSLASRSLVGMDDDDEEALRRWLSEWSKNSTLIFLGREGKVSPNLTTLIRYIDFGAFDPYSIFKKPIIAAFFQNKPLDEKVIDTLTQMVQPFTNPQVLAVKLTDVYRNQKPNGDRIYIPTDPVGTRVALMFEHLLEGTLPGYIKTAVKVSKAVKGETSEYGKKYTLADELLAVAGFRVNTFDPTAAAERYGVSQINKDLIDISKRLSKVQNMEYASVDEYNAAIKEYIRANNALFVISQEKYDAAVRLGADPMIMQGIVWPRKMDGHWGEK